MNNLFLGLGGNEGNVFETFKKAISLLIKHFGIPVNESCIYQTESWGDKTQPDYFNKVVEFEVSQNPQEILKICQNIETLLGRKRDENNQWASRTIDIDLLLYNNEQIVEKNLIIPHPRMLQRNFVMIPLAEIAGELIHPVANEKISALKNKTKDTLKVKVVSIN